MSLKVHVKKKLEHITLDIELEIGEGTVGILGYSGAGKSMLLKMIAGVEVPDEGTIIRDGAVIFDSKKKINKKARDREVGLLFQSYALFTHMTVYENIALALRHKCSKGEQKTKIEALCEMFHITPLMHQKTRELSGGQRQRVALARLLAQEPKVLLIDEPFSALDTTVKQALHEPFKQFLKHYKGYCIYVAHDPEEVFRNANQVAIMAEGKIIESGEKSVVFEKCQKIDTAKLLGYKNFFATQVEGYALATIHQTALVWVDSDTEGLEMVVKAVDSGFYKVGLTLALREDKGSMLENQEIASQSVDVIKYGDTLHYECTAQVYREKGSPKVDDSLKIKLPKEHLLLLKQ